MTGSIGKACEKYMLTKRWLSVFFVLILGVFLSLLVFLFAYRSEQIRLVVEFEHKAQKPLEQVSNRVEESLSSVRSLVAFFESSKYVDRQEFNKFASSILTWNNSIQALEWVPRVLAQERGRHEYSGWANGLQGYRITERNTEGEMIPAQSRREYFPVFYVEPLKGNELALGFDVTSEPTRFMTLERARQSRKIAVSNAINLVQSSKNEIGILMAAPLFRRGQTEKEGRQYEELLEGFVLAVLNVPKLVEMALEPWDEVPEFGSFYIFVHSPGTAQKLLLSHQKTSMQQPKSIDELTQPYAAKGLQVADQEWEIVVSVPEHWPPLSDLWKPWSLLVFLLALTAVSTVIAHMRHLGLMEQARLAASLHEKNQDLEIASRTLAKYLPQQVWNDVLSQKNPRFIGATRKPLTIFFGDIVGFTNLSQEISPEELTYVLNDFFSEMSEIGERHGATLDKFAGDAVVMFFGDPMSKGSPQDAVSCVEMALEMQCRMDDLRKKWTKLGVLRPLRMRIGIHSGDCNVGNFGSNDRMSYTIVGLNVNLAARIQKLGLPDGVTITGETQRLVEGNFVCVPLKRVGVRGVDRKVDLFSVAANE